MLTISIALRPANSLAADKVSDGDAVKAPQRHADQRDDQRILDGRQPFAENDPVMIERQRVVGAKGLSTIEA